MVFERTRSSNNPPEWSRDPFHESKKLDSNELEKVKKWINTDYYRRSREKTYKGLRKDSYANFSFLIPGAHSHGLQIFHVQGKHLMIQVDIDRFGIHTRQFYSADWTLLDFGLKFPRNPTPIDKPKHLDDALDISAALSCEFPICRVDLYLLPDSRDQGWGDYLLSRRRRR